MTRLLHDSARAPAWQHASALQLSLTSSQPDLRHSASVCVSLYVCLCLRGHSLSRVPDAYSLTHHSGADRSFSLMCAGKGHLRSCWDFVRSKRACTSIILDFARCKRACSITGILDFVRSKRACTTSTTTGSTGWHASFSEYTMLYRKTVFGRWGGQHQYAVGDSTNMR